jgi:hypothetical protein
MARVNDYLFSIVERIKLNSVKRTTWKGREVYIKRRNLFGIIITPFANCFFRIVGAPAYFRSDVHAWQEAEMSIFRRLNPRFGAEPMGPNSVCQDALPGASLWTHLQKGTLTRKMLIAAGREFHRAHQLFSTDYNGPWSHGDGAMRNVLFDPETGRARLIDFELRHDPKLSADDRHAEDLLAFLLDLLSVTPRRSFERQALLFLRAYGEANALRALRQRLETPKGMGRIWWMIRTNFASNGKIARGLARLGRAMDHGALFAAERASNARRLKSRTPVVQPVREGMPKVESLTPQINGDAAVQSAG